MISAQHENASHLFNIVDVFSTTFSGEAVFGEEELEDVSKCSGINVEESTSGGDEFPRVPKSGRV